MAVAGGRKIEYVGKMVEQSSSLGRLFTAIIKIDGITQTLKYIPSAGVTLRLRYFNRRLYGAKKGGRRKKSSKDNSRNMATGGADLGRLVKDGVAGEFDDEKDGESDEEDDDAAYEEEDQDKLNVAELIENVAAPGPRDKSLSSIAQPNTTRLPDWEDVKREQNID